MKRHVRIGYMPVIPHRQVIGISGDGQPFVFNFGGILGKKRYKNDKQHFCVYNSVTVRLRN